MQQFTSKQLYLMNGGNKLYIYKDGFGDVYEATPAEEARWAQEVMASALAKIETAENSADLNNAVENLLFHKWQGLQSLLLSKMRKANSERKFALASALLTAQKIEKNIALADANTVQHGTKNTDDFFLALRDLRNEAARLFLLTCLEGDNDELSLKAIIILEIWAYSGMPALRQNNLLAILQPENKHSPKFQMALQQLRLIFQLTNKG